MKDTPTIKFSALPLGVGCYLPDENLIILEEWLLEYPKWYKIVLDHELKHAEIFNNNKSWLWKTWENIKLEYSIREHAELMLVKRRKMKNKLETNIMTLIINLARIPGDTLSLALALGLKIWRAWH